MSLQHSNRLLSAMLYRQRSFKQVHVSSFTVFIALSAEEKVKRKLGLALNQCVIVVTWA